MAKAMNIKSLFCRLSFILLLIGTTFTFISCDNDDIDSRKKGENRSFIMYLKSEAGSANFNISTNGTWNVSLDEAASNWAIIKSSKSGSGNSLIEIGYFENEGFNRSGRLFISMPEISVVDTLYLKQYGQLPLVEFISNEFTVNGFGDKAVVPITSNMTKDQLADVEINIDYGNGESGWIKNFMFGEDIKSTSFEVIKNTSSSDRSAKINLILTDGLGEKYISTCTVAQSRLGGSENTKKVSFEDVRTLIPGATGSLLITEDISITGLIISDRNNPNVAANPNLTQTTIDYNVNYCTAYIQNSSATYGFALKTQSTKMNIMQRYDNVTLWLKGLTLVKEANPERYTLKDISDQNYIAKQEGTASSLVNKEKYINELTDTDLYTFVKLKECELPIRKGPFTPVNEGYTVAYAAYRVDVYPLVIRDRKGGSSYLMTNMECPYRRDGSTLPQGSGSISGIIVHEKYERFDSNGNIGKYQVRHLTREDINIAQDASNSFSKIICEWNKFTDNAKIVSPTSGVGELSQTYSTGNIYGTQDYTYLGPITGIQSEDNKGVVASSEKLGIAKTVWWNNNKGESWVIKFSTKGVTSDQLSLQISTFHNALGAPRYWIAEISNHGNNDGIWESVQEYTIPDPVQWATTLYTQMSGLKSLNIPLPLSLLNQENAYVRLRVTSNKAGTASTYDGTTIINESPTVLSYVSVRYNK